MGGMNMGLGNMGRDGVIFKRKYRWTFKIKTCAGDVSEFFLKTAARPSLTVEETEINYLNSKSWIPGKASWETMEVVYLDASVQDNAPLWGWLASVYDFTQPLKAWQSSKRGNAGSGGYAGQATLTLYDGCGTKIEQWILNNVWPTAINWNDLDYSSSDICEITLTMRYSEVEYKNYCGQESKPCECAGCS